MASLGGLSRSVWVAAAPPAGPGSVWQSQYEHKADSCLINYAQLAVSAVDPLALAPHTHRVSSSAVPAVGSTGTGVSLNCVPVLGGSPSVAQFSSSGVSVNTMAAVLAA